MAIPPLTACLVSTVVLSGCMSSAVSDISTADVVSPQHTAAARAHAGSEPVPEVQIVDGRAQTSVTMQASPATAQASTMPAAAATDSAAATQAPLMAMNARQNSIYATQPARIEEVLAATQAGVTVPAFVPVPGVNPALASLYGNNAIQPATPGVVTRQIKPQAQQQQAAGDAATQPDDQQQQQALQPQQPPSTPKSGRLNNGEQVQVAGLFSAQPQNPAGGQDFDATRFGITAAPTLPGAGSDSTPQPGSDIHPLARLNSFFPPKPQVSGNQDSEEEEDDDQPQGLAALISAPGLARVAPNGLWIQTPYVETDCFKPNLIHMLRTVQAHFGKPPVITSGYRTAAYNQEAGGVNGSLHTSCSAADIQINGVSKWELANYLRSLPDRGGVGTYCYTNSVHIDTGNQRDWDWRCRKKRHKHH